MKYTQTFFQRIVVITLLLLGSVTLGKPTDVLGQNVNSSNAPLGVGFNTVNITTITGKTVSNSVVSWQTLNGSYNVEHLAGSSPEGDLLVFYWQPDGLDWRVVNVSQITGKKASGAFTNWQTTNGPYTVEHLAGSSPEGDLLVFYWQPDGLDWQVVNVSQITGKKVSGPFTSWQTTNGPYTVEHLAGSSPEGDLLVFYWQPDGLDWRVVNVSQITGKKVSGAFTNWQTTNGPYTVEHLAGSSPEGDLLVFYWQPDGLDWRVVNVSQITGKKVSGAFTNWQTTNGSYNVEHLAGSSPEGDLLVFYWQPDGLDWRVVDVSQITRQKISSVTTAYQLQDGSEKVELLGARGADNSLLYFWWKPSRDWQVMNLTQATGYAITVGPTSWQTTDGDKLIEHFASVADSGNLIVFWGDNQPRRLTDALSAPYDEVKQIRSGKVLIILWDWHAPADANMQRPSRAEVESAIYGASGSVQGYYSENSNQRFTIENASVLGWYNANFPWAHYAEPRGQWCWLDQEDLPEDRNCNNVLDPGEDLNNNNVLDGPDGILQADEDTNGNHKLDYDLDGNGWLSGHAEKWSEAIRMADDDFDFASFDTNKDGYIAHDELSIVNVIAQASGFGQCCHAILAQEYPDPHPLVVDGVTLADTLEVYLGKPVNIGLIAHELGHLLLSYQDMYFSGYVVPFAAGSYSLMDNGNNLVPPTHIDPFHKLKSGWLLPNLVLHTGSYNLQAVENSHTVLVLMDPQHSSNEYFVIENRWPGASYDRSMFDTGLGIWHIIEDPTVYNSLPPPVGVTQVQWDRYFGGWARRGIRMVRPIPTPNDSIALWDGSEPSTGYDLLSTPSDPQKAALQWADGSASGFAIKQISCSGPTMSMYIEVPGSNGVESIGDSVNAPTCPAPKVNASQTQSLSVDPDNNHVVSPGDTLQVQAVITNNGDKMATGVAFKQELNSYVELASSPLRASMNTDNPSFETAIGIVRPGDSYTVTYRLRIKPQIPVDVTSIDMQGTITGENIPTLSTDDPNTTVVGDPTKIEIVQPQKQYMIFLPLMAR